jgi:hypothetical protein
MATFGQLISFGPRFNGGLLCTLKVYHYITGTTTTKNVYTDREKTTTDTQPSVSDSNGMVHFYADGLYKFRIDGATDGVTYTTLDTIDKWAVGDQGSTLSGEGDAISSASTLVLGTDGDSFHVTGSTGPIIAISGTQARVTLVFDSTPTLTHSGNLILQYATDYVASANSTMVLLNEMAGVYRELSRSPAFVDIAAAGDLPVGSGNDATSKLTVGPGGTVLMSRAAATNKLAYVAALNKYIYGLTYDVGTDATNDININTGGCMDATGAYGMTLGAALGKQSDSAWAVGGTTSVPLGGLDTGAVGNNDYYIWLIARSDTGVVDALFSLSSTAPTMPSNYNFKRLIGWFKRTGGTIVAFKTYELHGGGLELDWTAPTLDINLANTLTTSRRTDAVKVPLNFSVLAHLTVVVADTVASNARICCPDETDAAPSTAAAPLTNVGTATGSQFDWNTHLDVRTSATGTIAARAVTATVNAYLVSTQGFSWERRN